MVCRPEQKGHEDEPNIPVFCCSAVFVFFVDVSGNFVCGDGRSRHVRHRPIWLVTDDSCGSGYNRALVWSSTQLGLEFDRHRALVEVSKKRGLRKRDAERVTHRLSQELVREDYNEMEWCIPDPGAGVDAARNRHKDRGRRGASARRSY
jgi:hypothetical protein